MTEESAGVTGRTSDSWYARPVFFVTDCQRALRFYCDLGFREAWRYEEQRGLLVVQVDRAGVELILNQDGTRAGKGRLFLSLERGVVAKCVAEFVAAGIAVHDGNWGMPVKVVADSDGNELLFFDEDLNTSEQVAEA
ncbi:MAG: VOC family protein [Planctomycetota bacterium]